MKTPQLLCGAAASALLLLVSPAQAANLRWMGLDMNTNADSPSSLLTHVDTTEPNPINILSSLPFAAGPNLLTLTGSATATSGSSTASTAWSISGPTDTLTMTLNHSIFGAIGPDNHAGSEGVFYFYALTPGTLTVTYDYGFEEVTDPTAPYKASERGRSNARVLKASKGLGDTQPGDGIEIVGRAGERIFTETVTPADDLIALAFDLQILENPQETTISGGYVTMTFTPVPEPSSAALLGGAGLLALLRRRRQG